jgi:hypothetical protein
MDRNQFFNNLFDDNGDAAEAIRAQRQLAFEERIVKRAFSDSGVKVGSWGKLVKECQLETGLPKLNFRWFNANTRFPARLCGRRIPRLHELTIADLFKPAANNRLFKAITKNLHRQDVDDTKGFAFVFPVVRTMYCAHNLTDIQSVGAHWTITTEDAILTVEPATALFKAIGPSWFLS